MGAGSGGDRSQTRLCGSVWAGGEGAQDPSGSEGLMGSRLRGVTVLTSTHSILQRILISSEDQAFISKVSPF